MISGIPLIKHHFGRIADDRWCGITFLSECGYKIVPGIKITQGEVPSAKGTRNLKGRFAVFQGKIRSQDRNLGIGFFSALKKLKLLPFRRPGGGFMEGHIRNPESLKFRISPIVVRLHHPQGNIAIGHPPQNKLFEI